MSYCMKCLKEISETELKCPACGEETAYSRRLAAGGDKQQLDKSLFEEKSKMPQIGYTIGLISFIISFIPFVCLLSTVLFQPGIVVSAIALARFKKSEKAKKGLIFSILSGIIGFVIYIASVVVLALLSK